MYKDKNRQRETQRERQRRYRRDRKGVTEEMGVTVTDAEAAQIEKDMVKMGFTPVMTKRGKDIKCFADLPPDVQATIIDRLSESNDEKHKRTQTAIKYQHIFPNRFYSTGVAI